MTETMQRPRKRLFIFLISLSLLVSATLVYALWKVSFIGLSDIGAYLPYILGILLGGIVIAAGVGILGIVAAISGLPSVPFFRRQAWMIINVLFPIAVMIGKLFQIDKERIERSFIEVSNQMIRQRQIKVRPEQLLLLAPHCIQDEKCPYKITRDTKNCKRCGRCQVGELLTLSEELGFHFAVATGGTLSRQIIKNTRPRAVLAIACERDLTSGIQDIYPLPVIGVLNQRPNGPCNNTKVEVANVEAGIREFIE